MLQNNEQTTIKEAIREGAVFRSGAPDCGKLFAKMTNLSCHYSHDTPGAKRNRSVIPHQKLFQRVEMDGRQEEMVRGPRLKDGADQQRPGDDGVMQIRLSEERGPRRRSNPL
jgi:hypothetical protein